MVSEFRLAMTYGKSKLTESQMRPLKPGRGDTKTLVTLPGYADFLR